MHVLVADDDRIISHLLCALMRTRGHRVTPAFDAMQTLMYAMRPPAADLILLDVNMPGGTGLGVLERLKASTRTVMIPVIVVTGDADPAMRERVSALGAAAFVAKPIDQSALFETIDQVIAAAKRDVA